MKKSELKEIMAEIIKQSEFSETDVNANDRIFEQLKRIADAHGIEIKNVTGTAHIIWQVDDVLAAASEMSEEVDAQEAQEIIDKIERHKDCSVGISWDTIYFYISDFVNKKRKRGGQWPR